MKLIGVTPRIVTVDDSNKEFFNQSYSKMLARHGFNYVLIPAESDIDSLLPIFDGFLITGGNDTHPYWYGEEDQGVSSFVPECIDIVDKKVVEYALAHNKPMLGICRGIQSINVFMGGTLYQNIPNHRNIKDGQPVHTLQNPYINLDETIITNSYHHQALKDVAKGLKVIGYAEDKTIELVVGIDKPIIATQFHPELKPDDAASSLIFETFKDWVYNGYTAKEWK